MNRVSRLVAFVVVIAGLSACTNPMAPSTKLDYVNPNVDYVNPNVDYVNPNVDYVNPNVDYVNPNV